jgi:hypothetical protein
LRTEKTSKVISFVGWTSYQELSCGRRGKAAVNCKRKSEEDRDAF